MSNQFFLEETDIDTLINLLLRSQQSRTREALCFSIGIDPKRLSFLRDSSESDFFLLLIRYLNEIGEQEALCKLCCKELLPVFNHGKYAPILSEIAAKLNCNQKLSQNSANNQQPTVPSSIPTSRVSFNPFYQLAKNKLITGGTILLIGLAGFFIGQSNKTTDPNCPAPPSWELNWGLSSKNFEGEWNHDFTTIQIKPDKNVIVSPGAQFKRQDGHGQVISENPPTIQVNYPEYGAYKGTLVQSNCIKWTDGTFWWKG